MFLFVDCEVFSELWKEGLSSEVLPTSKMSCPAPKSFDVSFFKATRQFDVAWDILNWRAQELVPDRLAFQEAFW